MIMNTLRLPTIVYIATVVGLGSLVCASFLSNFMFGCLVLAGIAACIYWTILTSQVFLPLVVTQVVIVGPFSPPDGGTFSRTFGMLFLVCDLLLLIFQFTQGPSEELSVPLRIMIVTSPIVIAVTLTYALTLLGVW